MVITKRHLKIFNLYNGSLDWFARAESKSDKQYITEDEFYYIEKLIHDHFLVISNTTSDEIKNEHFERLNSDLESESLTKTVDYLSKKYFDPEIKQSIFRKIGLSVKRLFD